jgi:ABC-type Fe3+/spermidine/putrescine transport system ATPase subunit
MIQLSNIYKTFGKQDVLKDVQLHISKGEHVMLTGVSGSGKSTLLRIISGLEAPDQGKVFLDGQIVSENKKIIVSPEKRSIGFVPQDLGLWGNLNVRQNIRLGRRLDDSLYNELLKKSELAELEKKSVSLLSYGECQRVALVRTLVSKPKILLLDEPFASLDLLKKQSFYIAMKSLVNHECTLVTVTHDPMDWNGLQPDRLVVLEDSNIKDDYTKNSRDFKFKSNVLKVWQTFGFRYEIE